MTITRCVPLPGHGHGLVARFGDLIAVSDGLGADPDPLLGVVERVRATAGDGAALVRTAARVALESDGPRAFACAGMTCTDELVVLVSGDAVVTVIVDGGEAVILPGSNSLIPVSQVFTGAVINATLVLAESTAELPVADGRYRLDGGIVHGTGLAITVTSHADPDLGVAGLGEPERCEPEPAAAGLEITLRSQSQTTIVGFQAPYGVLMLDDGTGFALDADYVVGREPALDTDVATGRARPLRIADPEGTVSRLHLRICVIGERVMVSDLGSGNGSVLQPPDGEALRLIPNEPTAIEPGARILLGGRSFEYLSCAAQPPREG
jgi:FHA domain